ncbi:MAG: hypothetical protein COV70_04095 [Parcubacteria group bacterium CG11_big_fil_rev_8_21_14_0_20_39_22]|nr:MAG: hypothetical protein COV70_04095 [Parcubacteria group bacterium CG11_big_fil_rev_8_21_14_0_20_39_22]
MESSNFNLKREYIRAILYFMVSIFAFILILSPLDMSAQQSGGSSNIEQLQSEIRDRNDRIAELEKEIAKYELQVQETGAEANTLQSVINRLNAERLKLLTEIKSTEAKLGAVSLTIEEIGVEIFNTEEKINTSSEVLAKTIKDMNKMESISFIERVLTEGSLSEVLDSVETLENFQRSVQDHAKNLQELRLTLISKRQLNEKNRENLVSLREKISDQKEITEANKREKAALLEATKSEEENYRRELERRQEIKEAFEQELFELESQLNFEVDPGRLPDPGTKIFTALLPDMAIESCYTGVTKATNCVTQYFGNTPFAKSGAYSGQGHNGIDFRASRGTELYAPADGIIEGTGNTSVAKGCYSYGKWILINHGNGVSTAYGHLDLVKVSQGQSVKRGDLIGYTGSTGYSTGPHLHISVFASQGVKVMKLGDIPGRRTTPCSPVAIPVADLQAYLNPLDYF